MPIVAITGSNGKSTVTSLTGLALTEAGYRVGVGGNIGEPALNLLMDNNEYDVIVLELSSFQLETTHSLNSASSTILNISEDHMDRYVGLEDYICAKTRVFSGTELAVIPNGLSEQGLVHSQDVVHFTVSNNVINSETDYYLMKIESETYLAHSNEPLVAVSGMKLQGHHHYLNALAMMALCQPFDVEARHFTKVLAQFSGLPHRTELVLIHDGVTWINDSKGTNVGATSTALESLGEQTPGKLLLIAGGVSKDADFMDLVEPIKKHCKQVVLFGRDREKIAQDISQDLVSNSVKVELVETLEEAVSMASVAAKAQDYVLFSPACASFDQFKNYIKRGEAFVDLVEQACGIKHTK